MSFRRLRQIFSSGLKAVARKFFRAMRGDEELDVEKIDRLIAQMDSQARAEVAKLAEKSYTKFLRGASENLLPLRTLLLEREMAVGKSVSAYRHIVRESEHGLLTIGRRTQDVLREFAIKEIEAGFIGDNPGTFSRQGLFKRMQTSKIDVNRTISQDELFALRQEFFDRVPMFREDGRLKMFLLNRKGKFMAFDAQHYSDLVAVTTVDEARYTATIERTRKIGSRFIKFTSTGKGPQYYAQSGDDECAAIDGKIFAIVQETTQNGKTGAVSQSGTFYPYVKEVITGPYNKPHPFCRHQPVPIPESAA